jgi:BirA family transcriptional regulator, biotin operon repressor / biotin---[acetyl-CoA-carboxylase] ligase
MIGTIETATLACGFFRILELPTIDSTSEEAKRLGRAGAPEGTLVWALQQTAGHGRFGRTWISPPGNLYFSLLLRPDLPPQQTMQLTFVAALAMADTISALLPAGAAVTCKWPNDVLIAGKKVAGILLESSLNDGGRVDSLVIGIGVNVTSHPPSQEVHYPATSLRAEGATGETARSVLDVFCPSFLVWYGEWSERGFQPVREAWLARADRLHRPIEVRLDRDTTAGIFADLDPTGALVLDEGRGQRLILAGDVFPAEF